MYSRLPSTLLWLQASGSVKSWREVLIELLVFLVLDFGAWQCPQRFGLVDRLVFERGFALLTHPDREADVVGVVADQGAQAKAVGKFLRVILQVQRDGRAALGDA